MQIKVTYKSEILGEGVFWEGSSEDINEIRNFPARDLAKEVVKDGQTHKIGMWTVEEIK